MHSESLTWLEIRNRLSKIIHGALISPRAMHKLN